MAQRKTIASSFVVGQTTNGAITLNNSTLMGVTISGSKITGTAMTFTVSTDGTNYYALYDDTSTEVSLTVTTAARSYIIDPKAFLPWSFVKARLGTSASAVAQATADQAILFHIDLL